MIPDDRSSRVAALFRPVDIASLAAFRISFGLLMLWSSLRFLWNGWVTDFFVTPQFHFKYWGFGWVKVLPPPGMHVVFAALAALAALIALGLFYRVAAILFFLAFTYVQLLDVSLYLNHYYLVSLLAFLLMFLPAHGAWSLDARWRPTVARATVPALAVYALRLQVAVVYTGAGVAKLGTDWVLHAQPLTIWLSSRTALPVVGPWLNQPWVAYGMSWAGILFDTTIALWLSIPRARPFAFVAVIFFHLGTSALFPIGMFPAIMIVSAMVFFAPSWPRRLHPALRASDAPARAVRPRCLLVTAVAAYAIVQLVLPFRYALYRGNVLWDEQGMRFSWRVMVREKNGSTTFVVRDPATGREWHVSPRRYLQDHQEREMARQPDLIWQLAQHIARDFQRRGHGKVEVRAEARASLNGRRGAPLVDPSVDLTAVGDGLGPKTWIMPAPQGPPARLRPI